MKVGSTGLSEEHNWLSATQGIRELVDEAMALQDRGSGELQISRYQAGLWAEFEELAEDTEQAQAWQQSVSGLLKLDQVEPTPLPAGLHVSVLDGAIMLANGGGSQAYSAGQFGFTPSFARLEPDFRSWSCATAMARPLAP